VSGENNRGVGLSVAYAPFDLVTCGDVDADVEPAVAPPTSPASPARTPADPEPEPTSDCRRRPRRLYPPPPRTAATSRAGTFTVIGDDPHRFDSDNDGIGCEA
jgi:hypothetical protein